MASREVVPRTWPQGLNAAERIKAERERAALANPENPEEEVFDDLLWQENVTDLHRVMEVAKSLWLLLEHSNEAMVRVALEIALDGTYKKVLWWPDFWFSDHDKREYFKEIVRLKVAIAIANAKGSAVDLSEFEKNDQESELVTKLRQQIAELEAALKNARLEKEAADARIRELEAAAREAEERLAQMEKSLEQLRREVKEFRRQSELQGNSVSQEELDRLKQQLKQSEEKNVQLEEIIKELRKKLEEGNKSGETEKLKSELQMAKKRIEELEQKLMDAQKEIALLKRQKGGAPGPATPIPTDDSEAIRRLKEELEEERRRRQELEELLKKTQDEMAQLQKDIDAERKKSLDLSNRLKQMGNNSDTKKEIVTEIKEVTVPGGLSEEQMRELEELRAKAEELEKLKAKLKKRDQQIASLQEDNDKLNEEQVRLLKLLKQVREQLRILMELAEKKGLGDVIKKLFEEAGLGKTMADPDYTCFDRLYDDALRRMDKQRRMEWYRLGNTGEPPPSFKAKHAYHRRESPERMDTNKGRAAISVVYCRNCGASVEVPNSSPSPQATRSPSPFERYDSAASTYYQPGNTYLQQSYSSASLGSNRSLSPHSRSMSPTPSGAMDLRIQSVRPANGGHIAISVATWGDSMMPPNPAGFKPAQTFHPPSTNNGQMSRKPRSRSPEMRARPSERNLPPLRDTSHPQNRMMTGSASATELRRGHGQGPAMFVSGCGPGKLKGAMFVQEPRPFRAAEFTGEDPKMMWRPQKSFPLNPPCP